MHRPDSSPKTSERPRLGLALGSGAARGWAHVGVLRALDEWGVEVDVYAGCSVGALIGAGSGYAYLREKQLGGITGLIEDFVRRNPRFFKKSGK